MHIKKRDEGLAERPLPKGNSMSAESNKAVDRRYYQAAGAFDLDALREVLAPDFVAHQPGMPVIHGREAFLDSYAGYREAFRDSSFEIEDQLADGDRVATRTTWHATHTGDFPGLPASGRHFAISGIAIARIKDGLYVERWLITDQVGFMKQLGQGTAAEAG